MYRQGDVLVIPVPAEDTGTDPVPREGNRIVLAHGEATGHAHAIAERGAMFPIPGTMDHRLRLVQRAFLRHEEHAPIELPPGDYVVRRQREYTPEAIRWVAD